MMMKRKIKKYLALALAVVLLTSILPMGVLADSGAHFSLEYSTDSGSAQAQAEKVLETTMFGNVPTNVYLVTLPAGAILKNYTWNINESDFGFFGYEWTGTQTVFTADGDVDGKPLWSQPSLYLTDIGFQDEINRSYLDNKAIPFATENVKGFIAVASDYATFGEYVIVQINSQGFVATEAGITVGSADAKPGDTVTIPVKMTDCPAFASLQATLTYDTTAMTLTELNNVNVQNGTLNPATGIVVGAASNNYTIDGTMFNAVFQIKDDAALGEYAVGLDVEYVSDVDDKDLDVNVTAGTVTVAQVTDAELAAGYNVVMDLDKTVNVGDAAAVAVNVTGKGADAKNYTNFTMSFSYDPNALSFTGLSGLSDGDETTTDKYEVSDKDGVITVCKYGTEQVTGETAFTLNFTANATGTVTCTSAKFGTKDSAWDQDEVAANLADADTVITVAVEIVNVTVPDSVTGADTTEKGKDYSFTLTDPDANYNYTVEAEVNGEKVTVNGPDAEGKYTIPGSAVTGDITITVSKTPKTYEVTVSGEGAGDITLPDRKPTYGTDYVFTLNEEADYDYDVTVTVGDKLVNATVGENGKYTIPGAEITGPVAISVTKTVAAPIDINFVGTGAGQVAGGANQSAEIGKDFTFTVTEDREYYDYTVTAKDGDTVINLADPVDNVDGTYTYTIPGSAIKNGSKITVTVTETRNLHMQMLASEYVKLDGGVAILYRATAKLKEGERLVMDLQGQVFPFYRTTEETYKADLDNTESGVWCFVDWTDKIKTAAEMQAHADDLCASLTTATSNPDKYVLSFDNDVNLTGIVDTSDAQMVWNMYNAMYESHMSNTDWVKRFLEANTNRNDLVINVLDSRAIVASLLD